MASSIPSAASTAANARDGAGVMARNDETAGRGVGDGSGLAGSATDACTQGVVGGMMARRWPGAPALVRAHQPGDNAPCRPPAVVGSAHQRSSVMARRRLLSKFRRALRRRRRAQLAPVVGEEPAEAEDWSAAAGKQAPGEPLVAEQTQESPRTNTLAVQDEKVDQLIEAMDRPRQQFEALLHELTTLPGRAEELMTAMKSQADSVSRVHEALAALTTETDRSLGSLSEHAQKQTDLTNQIREALTTLTTQTTQNLQALSEYARKESDTLEKISTELSASRDEIGLALGKLTSGVQDLSSTSHIQAENTRRMHETVAETSDNLIQSMKARSRRLTWLLTAILVMLALLVVAAAVGIYLALV